MLNADPNEEKEALVQGYVEGLLTPEESARLHELVRQDPMLARMILENMRMDGAIRDLVGEREKGMAALVPPPPGAPPPRGKDPSSSTARLARIRASKDVRRTGSERSSRLFIGLMAAAGLLIAIIVAFFGTTGPTDEQRERIALEKAWRDFEERERKAQERLVKIKKSEEAYQQRLLEISKQRADLSRPPVQAPPDPVAEEKWLKEVAKLDTQIDQVGLDLIKNKEEEEEVRAGMPIAPPAIPAKPEPPSTPKPLTIASVAKLERLDGNVTALVDGQKREITGAYDLLPSQRIETSPGKGRAALTFGDKTRVEIGVETVVGDVTLEKGKRIHVASGSVWADVKRQPPGQPMVFVTPHGEAKVLGTSLRIIVVPGKTTLEVTEGKVQLKRTTDGKTVDVVSGQYAVATAGVEPLQSKPLPMTLAQMLLEDYGVVKIDFGPEGIQLTDPMMLNDSAKKFDPAKGYGWVEGAPAVWAGLSPTPTDKMKAGYVAGGTADTTATWRMALLKGRYHVTVCVGGVGAVYPEQGPHHVIVEGKPLFDSSRESVFTRNGAFVENTVTVDVQDGELTMDIGGYKTKVKSKDNSEDTILIYIQIRKAP